MPIDLNSNLYQYERTFAEFSQILGRAEEREWLDRSDRRLALLRRHCWDAELGCFNDYDVQNDTTTAIVNAAIFWPLVYGIATHAEAQSTVRLLPRLERAHGVSTCEESPESRKYQWGFPNAWPPVQVMVCRALARYGYTEDAERVARKYVETVAEQFESTGCLWEKYDALTGEPGGGEYDSTQMMGWSAGAFVHLAGYLYPQAR